MCFRCVWEAVTERYLTTERRGRSLCVMAEYFQGRWSGKLKPLALPGPTLLLSDRKVTSAQSRDAAKSYWNLIGCVLAGPAPAAVVRSGIG